ncbi:MAG: Uma2 family endonuclease [Candidatus Tectomicrobia bacterium]|uniref:Uma2 family endonuclease n=1 Tax=Tectimicrobiota bacterium TaxID=2528274 RepID=A0A937W1V0_UNCTE|nr:Uma2 family endonuclease [Candidatus Tectomicrobia bacterium]
MAIQPQLYTVTDFERFIALPEHRDQYFELIHGEIIAKVPTEEHGLIAGNIYGSLWQYTRQSGIGRAVIEVRVRAPEDDYNSRQPDLAVFTDTTRPVVTRGAVLQMPDVVIEVKSPDDTYAAMRERATYYLEHGARLVWLIYPAKCLVEVYRQSADSDILTGTDTLQGEAVLPGFALPLQEIFALS